MSQDDPDSITIDGPPAPGSDGDGGAPGDNLQSTVSALRAEVDELRAIVEHLRDPMGPTGRVFYARLGTEDEEEDPPAGVTFGEVAPNVETDAVPEDERMVTLEGGRAVSGTDEPKLLVIDPFGFCPVLEYQTGKESRYVRLNSGLDFYNAGSVVARNARRLNMSEERGTAEILEFFIEDIDGREFVGIRFKEPPDDYVVLQANTGNVVWDDLRVKDADPP